MDDMWHVEHVPIEGIEPGVLAHRLIFFHNRGYLGGGTLIYPGCRRIASEPPAHLSYPTLKTTPQPEEHSMSKSRTRKSLSSSRMEISNQGSAMAEHGMACDAARGAHKRGIRDANFPGCYP